MTGITAGILTATSFLLWVYSTRVLSEPILTFFVNLSILFLYLTLKEGTKKYPLLLGVSLGLGYLTKELAGFLFPVLLLIIFEKRFAVRTRVRNFLLCGAAGAAVVAPWYIFLALTTQEGLSEIAGRPFAKGAAFTWGIRELEETVQIFTFGRTISALILIFFYTGVAVAVHRYWRQRELSDKVLLLSIFTWVILLTFNVYISTQERRLIPILIPLYVLSSRAFVAPYERVKKKEVSIEATKPIAFIFVVFLLSYWNANFIPEEWGGEFEFTSFHKENPLDYPLEVLFKDDCRRFSSQYDDAVVGGLLMNLFYLYTEGKYESYEISMKKFSKMGSENILYNYDDERGFSEEGLMKQMYEKNVTVLVLYNHHKVEKVILFLRSHPDIFKEKTQSRYRVTFVFEVDREKLEEYMKSLEF